MATKYSILENRLEESRKAIAQSIAQLEADEAYLRGLDATPCGLTCGGCGALLATEGAFARHFIVPDSRYLNLGNCPKSDRA